MQLIISPHGPYMVDQWHSLNSSQEWVWLKIQRVSSFSIILHTMNGTTTHTATWAVIGTCKVEGEFGMKVYVPLAKDDNCKPWTRFDLTHRQYLRYCTRVHRALCGISDGELDIPGCKVTSVYAGISMETKNPSHSAGVTAS